MTALLEIRGLHKSFGGLTAVNNISFSLEEGEIAGLLGPNGSGKTTTMNLISGNLKPDNGSVVLRGKDITASSPHLIARAGVARTFQLVRVIEDMTVSENILSGVAFGRQPKWGGDAESECDEILDRIGLRSQKDNLAGNLTYVNQKRLELGRALSLHPDILLLDEWLAGLNASELQEGIKLIRKLSHEGTTILMVEHVMSAIHSLCKKCIVMNSGEMIAHGLTKDVMNHPEVIRAYLGGSDA
ncbi:MAG: ABC transporter ATP-binding protein [Methyloligellaceae bacterium]